MTRVGPWVQPDDVAVGPQNVASVPGGFRVETEPVAGFTLADFVRPPDGGPFFLPEFSFPVIKPWPNSISFSSGYNGDTGECGADYSMLGPTFTRPNVFPDSYPPGATTSEFEDLAGHGGEVRLRGAYQTNISFGPHYEAGEPGFGSVWDGGRILRVPASFLMFDVDLLDYPAAPTRTELQSFDVLQLLPALPDGADPGSEFTRPFDVTVPHGDGLAFITDSALAGTVAYRGPVVGAGSTVELAWLAVQGTFLNPEADGTRDHAIVSGFYTPSRYRFIFLGRTPLRGRQRASGVIGSIPLRGRQGDKWGIRGRQNSNL